MNVDFQTAVKMFFANYANFNGRSTRAEYWWVVLFLCICSLVLGFIDGLIGWGGILGGLFSLATLVPGLAICWRRLHDVGQAGGWYFIAFTGIGVFLLLYWFVQPSGPDNRFGPDPYAAEKA